MSDFLGAHVLYSPWNSSGQNTGVGSFSLLQGIFPTQGLNPVLLHCRQILPAREPRSPTLQADSLPAEPLGKPKNTGVGSLSILQWIFPTQELNWGVLHCRQILYQVSYQESQMINREGSFLGEEQKDETEFLS